MKISQLPNFSFEKKLWNRGYKVVAGVDEVGRGCFAGPIVASAVAFAPMTNAKLQITNEKHLEFRIDNSELVYIDDSKKLSARQRERADVWIRKNALTWGIGEANVALINRLGMGRATKIAFRRAISEARKRLGKSIEFLLIDAFFIPYVPTLPTRRIKDKKGRYRKNPKGRQAAIINGDEKSVSIAAASIVAKVYRDKLMLSLSKKPKYRIYGWGRNKGYGTREHQEAIRKFGTTRLHRRKFVKNFI